MNVLTDKRMWTHHGASYTPEYNTWALIKQRCLNPKNKDWHKYGGRGITVCDRWLRFDSFWADMGNKPTCVHSIERLDNSKGYNPDNCAWKLPQDQSRNTRRNVRVCINGRVMCLKEACSLLKLPYPTVKSRIYRGRTIMQSLRLEEP